MVCCVSTTGNLLNYCASVSTSFIHIPKHICLPPICFMHNLPMNWRINMYACSWMWLTLDYRKQARDVIDELVEEVRQVRAMIQTERNDHHFMQDEDRVVDLKIPVELCMWKGRFTISFVLNLLLIMWMTTTRSIWGPLLVVVLSCGADGVGDGMITFLRSGWVAHLLGSYYSWKLFAHIFVST